MKHLLTCHDMRPVVNLLLDLDAGLRLDLCLDLLLLCFGDHKLNDISINYFHKTIRQNEKQTTDR